MRQSIVQLALLMHSNM